MKWLLQNARARLSFCLKNPRYAASAAWREATRYDERFLSRITGSTVGQIRSFLNEPIETPDFARLLRTSEEEFRRLQVTSADLYAKKVLLQYAAVRALRPDVVVETGIANGVSSAYALLALKKNGKGRLHSVSLADPSFVPDGKKTGWFVPDWLAGSWETHFGDSKEILPPLLRRLARLDMFVHDSLHTYDHMSWEFEEAFPYLRPGGLLFADDALWNGAFPDFVKKTGTREARILHGVGVLRKNVT